MKPIGAAVAAAVLLWWTAGARAAEPVKTLEPLPPDRAFPAQAAAAGCGCASCAPCSSGATCRGCAAGGGLRAWLTYRPLHRVQCGECRGCCEGRWTPFYLYFLGSCKEHPCTGCGAGCASCGGASRPMFGSPTGWGLGMFGD